MPLSGSPARWLRSGRTTILPTMASGDDSPIFEDDESPPYSLEKMTDLVAVWDVALSDGVHKIEFEHGTTSGKRVVYVDGKEEIRKEWMFKLVGKETFCVGAAKTKATINIDAVSGFAYEYTLEINGKSLKKYMENRSKTTNTWVLHLDGEDFRVVLVTEREREAETQAEGEAGSIHQESDVGFNPRSPGSRLGPKKRTLWMYGAMVKEWRQQVSL
ncbi:fas apoptotic inhibitory molecule 1 isoform X3 [Canis lupus baileyi]|uniref:fas apoptotic inhibitory molecule 1 isoform X3 n=1 Tax=Canis lupus baileyi TaxID=143281 RepID=UPI003B9704F0